MSIEKPETNAETILPIMERDYQARIAALQSANEALGQANTGLALNYQQAQERIDALVKQLPDEMKDCTILFKECPSGHGYLTAANWVDHGCPTCARNTLEASFALSLRDRADLREELVHLRRAYSYLLRQYERLPAVTTEKRQPVETPVASDELGPLYFDDLCPQALRDNRLVRSDESRKRVTTPGKPEGYAGIEFTNTNECQVLGCPTAGPHRHLYHPTGEQTLEETIQQRRARIQATLDDEKSAIGSPDVTIPKTNPNIVRAQTLEQAVDASGEHGPHVGDPDGVPDVSLYSRGPQGKEFHGVGPFDDASDEDPGTRGDLAGTNSPIGDCTRDMPVSDEISNTPDKGTEHR